MTIKEVAARTGISADNLRYYERIGIIPHMPRTISGIRNYNEVSLRWIEFAMRFKKTGVSLEAISVYMKLARQGTETASARRAVLEKTRETIVRQIEELAESLKLVQFKLDNYYTVCLPDTNQLIDDWEKEQIETRGML
nr:MerR family transcriptional regulator [uncultured Anaeromusa sp.]